MDFKALFSAALGLGEDWQVEDVAFDGQPRTLTLRLAFKPGTRFAAPACGNQLLHPVHDTLLRRWRHLNFFQYRCELVAKVPRVRLPDGEVVQVEVPWARPGSGFTLLFEALAVFLATEMSVSAAAELLDEHDTRLWRCVSHHVEQAHARADWSNVSAFCVDDTSQRRGHHYVTVFLDALTRRVLLLTEGRGKEAIAQFAQALRAHGGDPARIRHVIMDMSAAYRAGVAEHFPAAQIVFDLFHIMQHVGAAVDQTRRALLAEGVELPKHSLWALRGNVQNLRPAQQDLRRRLMFEHDKLGRALGLRYVLQDIFQRTPPAEAEDLLRWWCGWAQRSRLPGFPAVARMLRAHWQGVVAYFTTKFTNGAMEATNGLIQLAKRRARGFRSFPNLRTMAYLLASKLDLDLPSLHPDPIY